MRANILFLVCLFVGLQLIASESVRSKNEVQFASKDVLYKQKFLFEIVHRIQEPLAFEEWIKLSDNLILDKSRYTKFDKLMKKFNEDCQLGKLLPKGEFFGAVVKSHLVQALQIFKFFVYARDWETFQSNACWARVHVNEGIFVFALTLTVIHRSDFEGLILPAIYEIFPQHFFNSKFVRKAEKFNYDAWSRQVMYEKELTEANFPATHDKPSYMRNYKTWQWWKLMGLDAEHWHEEKQHLLRDNIADFVANPHWVEAMQAVKKFWLPVDYTRDINMQNDASKLSYLMEDADVNAGWYYLNLDYPPFLDDHEFGFDKDPYSTMYFHYIRYFNARFYMEELSHGHGKFEDYTYFPYIQHGYNPQLISGNGVAFLQRPNNYEFTEYGFTDTLKQAATTYQNILTAITTGYHDFNNGTTLNIFSPQGYKHFFNMVYGNMDNWHSEHFDFYAMYMYMYFGHVEVDKFYDVLPNVFLNYETMMRDPLFFMFMKSQFVSLVDKYELKLQPYTRQQLLCDGVEIVKVDIDKLVTYFDYTDFDVSNLLSDKMHFIDGQYKWNKMLVARQQRLNHKPFSYRLTVKSTKTQRVSVRTYFAPKYNELGELISIEKNRNYFVQFDEYAADLTAGENVIEHWGNSHYFFHYDRVTYTEMYHLLLLALEDKYHFPLNISAPHCTLGKRMILPRGRKEGFPVQMIFIISPHSTTYTPQSNFDPQIVSGIGSGTRFVDDKPFLYPFDRAIDENEFFVPNFFFQDVKIYHIDTHEEYEKNYKDFGKFDYDYMKNFKV